jgi:hypothetical protein
LLLHACGYLQGAGVKHDPANCQLDISSLLGRVLRKIDLSIHRLAF